VVSIGRKKTEIASTPESVAATVVKMVLNEGVDVCESTVKKLFADTAPRQRHIVLLDPVNVFEKVISALSQDSCDVGGIRPVIIVTDSEKYNCELKKGLSAIAGAMQHLNIASDSFYPVIRNDDKCYLCTKRYKNAVANKGIRKFAKEPLTLSECDLPKKILRKICVTKCSMKTCSLVSICDYARLIRSLRNGTKKLQVYTQKKYDEAKGAGELPTRCVVIGALAPVVNIGPQLLSFSLSEKELLEYALCSVRLCGRDATMKRRVARHTKRIERLAKHFYNKVSSTNTESELLVGLMADMLKHVLAVKSISGCEFDSSKRWLRLYRKITRTMDHLLKAKDPFEGMDTDNTMRAFTVRVRESDDSASEFTA